MDPEQNQEVELSEDDIFAQAFDQAVAAADGQAPKEETAKEEPAKEEPAKEEPAKEEPANEEPAKEEPAKEVTSPLDQTTTDVAALREEIAALKAVPKEEPPVQAEKEDPPAAQQFAYTPEEQAILDNYTKEWDEHARAQELQQKKLKFELVQQLGQALDLFAQQIEQGLAPIVKGHVELQQERHSTSLKGAHPDYEALRPDVQAWIEKQPKYLRVAMKDTYDKGDTSDVIELFTSFKEATGRTQPKPLAPPKDVAPKKDEIPADKVADLAPVTSKRSVVQTGGVDLNDFDAGFAEALANLRR
jgi:hypothetical protein